MSTVLVTGSRTFTDATVIGAALAEFMTPGAVLIHGACRKGADRVAAEIWTAAGLAEDPHPALWRQYGKRAGYVRNIEMVALRPDVVVAFLDLCTDGKCPQMGQHGSHGASMTMRIAANAGIEVRDILTPEMKALLTKETVT